jgi:hypothetical protein
MDRAAIQMSQRKGQPNSTRTCIVLAMVLFGLMSIGYLLSRRADNKIESDGEEIYARIIRIYQMRSRGTYFKYEYFVNGKKYIGDEQLSGDLEIGDTVKIRYSREDPELSKMVE